MALQSRKEDVVVRFGGDDSKFRKTLNGVKSGLSSLTSGVAQIGGKLTAALGIGAGVGVGGLAAGLAQITQELDERGKTARALNTTVESLSELQFAITQTSDLTERQFNTPLQRMVRLIGAAVEGSKESTAVFDALGLQVSEIAAIPADQAFLRIIDALNRLPNAYQRASVAQKIFDDGWLGIIQTADAGTTELREHMLYARTLGTYTTESAQAAADLNDAIGRLNRSLEGLAYRFAPPAIEAINEFLGAFSLGGSGAKNLEAVNKEIERLEKIVSVRERVAGGEGSFLERTIGFLRGDDAVAKDISEARRELEKLRDLRDELLSGPKAQSGGAAAAPGLREADALASKTKRTVKEVERSGDDLRELVRVEANAWAAEHAYISAVQDDNASRMAENLERLKNSVQQMKALGHETRAGYYGARAVALERGISDPAQQPFPPVPGLPSLAVGQGIRAPKVGENVAQDLDTAISNLLQSKTYRVQVEAEVVNMPTDPLEIAVAAEGGID